MFDGTSLRRSDFSPPASPLSRRLLVYFLSGAYRSTLYGNLSNGYIGINTSTPQTFLDVNGGVTTPAVSGGYGVVDIAPPGFINNVATVEMRNPYDGTASEFRDLVSDNTGQNYIALSMPSASNTATLFGQTRSNITSLFTATTGGGAGRTLVIGTLNKQPCSVWDEWPSAIGYSKFGICRRRDNSSFNNVPSCRLFNGQDRHCRRFLHGLHRDVRLGELFYTHLHLYPANGTLTATTTKPSFCQ